MWIRRFFGRLLRSQSKQLLGVKDHILDGDRSEGYVVIAFDDARYLDIAANLALSVSRHEARPISVVINKAVRFTPAYAGLFSQVITVADDPAIRGAMNKVRLFDFTPYDRTMYIDADCLLFSPRIEFFCVGKRLCSGLMIFMPSMYVASSLHNLELIKTDLPDLPLVCAGVR